MRAGRVAGGPEHARKLPAISPPPPRASSEIVEHILGHYCPWDIQAFRAHWQGSFAQGLPIWAKSGPTWADLGRCWTASESQVVSCFEQLRSVVCGPCMWFSQTAVRFADGGFADGRDAAMTKIGQDLAKFGQVRWTSANIWSNSANSAQIGPTRPVLADSGPSLVSCLLALTPNVLSVLRLSLSLAVLSRNLSICPCSRRASCGRAHADVGALVVSEYRANLDGRGSEVGSHCADLGETWSNRQGAPRRVSLPAPLRP